MKHSRWITKRMFWSAVVLTSGTAALWGGKLDGSNYVLLCLGVIAGHHAEDLIKAWRNRGEDK